MVEGVAEYRDDPKQGPYRILILENTLKNMDATFEGCPIYVQHVDEVDLDTLQEEADGFVLKSFYNAVDGKHWAEFLVVSDHGHEAIRRGWQLSNSYIPQTTGPSGEWHGVQYQAEITSGEYEHLALVPNPRYKESVILTPEEFQKYNEDKKLELEKLSNSKGEKEEMPKFSFFKKQKVENDIDPAMSVILPKSGKEITLEKLVNDADKMAVDGNKGMADLEHKVKLHDGSYCNVGELVRKHKAMCDEMDAMKAKKDDAEEEQLDVDMKEESVDVEGDDKSMDDSEDVNEEHPEEVVHDEADEDKPMQPEEDEKEVEMAKKKKNAAPAKKPDPKELEKKRVAKEKADRLRNAHDAAMGGEEELTIDTSYEQVERGKSRYGSA